NADWVEIGLGYAGGSYSPGEAYYSSGAQGVNVLGQYIEGYGIVDFTSPRLIFPFPMEFGDVVTDSWEAIGHNEVTGTDDQRTGDSELEYDGYGTLILPHITLNDVVRVRQVSEQELDLGGITATFRDTIILWFSEDYNHYV